MLTAYQCETVAFVTDGGIICRDCATAKFGEMGTAALEEGIAEFVPQDVSCLIRYELDTIIGEYAAERANEEGDWVADPDAWDARYEAAPDFYTCDSCGGEIS